MLFAMPMPVQKMLLRIQTNFAIICLVSIKNKKMNNFTLFFLDTCYGELE